MNYHDASYELVKAHYLLMDWYNSNGGEEIANTLKSEKHLA